MNKEGSESNPDELQIPDPAPREAEASGGQMAEEMGHNEYSKEYAETLEKLEKAMVPLVEQLKKAIEDGYYDALLSDDPGGRGPTLVLREIIKQKQKEPRDIKVKFLAGGRRLPSFSKATSAEKIEMMEMMRSLMTLDEIPSSVDHFEHLKKVAEPYRDYLSKMDFKNDKVLVVSEYVSYGETVDKIGSLLKSIGVNNFDFAGVLTDADDALKGELKRSFGSKLFEGIKGGGDSNIVVQRGELWGVSGRKGTAPYPKRVTDYKTIKERRYDVKLMAERIIKQVWGD